MINRLARGYVHKGTALLQKKQFSVVHSRNYKGVKWFIYAEMQIKETHTEQLEAEVCIPVHTNIFMPLFNTFLKSKAL